MDRPERTARLSASELLTPGSLVDHFKVLRFIGQGGMAEVYLARDTKLGRRVALKIIHPRHLGSKQAINAFLLEAKATARFNHPHIVTIYYVGEHRGMPYVALEYLEGQTLRQRLREDRLALMEALRIGVAVAEALKEAHGHGVLHRDLKPENILVPSDGRVRVVDFGLAKVIARPESAPPRAPGSDAALLPGRTQETVELETSEPYDETANHVWGSPPYMAPEQWTGTACTPATDLWAFGVLLYELVAGRRPYLTTAFSELQALALNPQPFPPLPFDAEAPDELATLVARCLNKDPAARPAATEVLEVLQGLLLERRARSTSEERIPFRGLLSFEEQHAEFFFGRQAEVEAFLERMRSEAVLPVVGPSGAGKSSFVRAGVIPRLRETGRWTILSVRPGSQPFRTLASRLVEKDAITAVPDEDLPTRELAEELLTQRYQAGLWESHSAAEPASDETGGVSPVDSAALSVQLLESPSLLALMLQRLAEDRKCRVLLFVDQLEELYTMVSDEPIRARFMEMICGAADDAGEPVRVILTLRDDFLGRLAEGAGVRKALSHVTVIRSPGSEAMEETLTKPLARLGYAYDDPTLVKEMIAAVSGEPACLPLLQFVARMLWERRDPGRRLLLRSAYTAIGGVAGALARHADGVLEGMTSAQINWAKQILLRLVTSDGTRRMVARAEALGGLEEEAADVLGRLIEARLVTVRKGRGGEKEDGELELVHESLIMNWHRLSRWIEEKRGGAIWMVECSRLAEAWDRRGRRDADLLRGEALEEARRSLALVPGSVPELVRSFVDVAWSKAQRAVWRRRLLVLAGFVFLVAVSALLYHQNLESRHRWAESLREGSRSALSRGELVEARAKLRGSLEIEDSPLSRALWWQLGRAPLVWKKDLQSFIYDIAFSVDGLTLATTCLEGSRTVCLVDGRTTQTVLLRGSDDQIMALAFSPDGRSLASATWDGKVRLWDLTTRTSRVLAAAAPKMYRFSFHPDGALLAAGQPDGTIGVWRVENGERLKTLSGHRQRVLVTSFSNDGRLLATAGEDRQILLWDWARGQIVRRLLGHSDQVRDLRFSPDGKRLASASTDHTVRLWDLSAQSSTRVLRGHADGVSRLSFSPNGRLLASASNDRTVILWDAAAAAPVQVLRDLLGTVWGLAFSPDGKTLATGGGDRTLQVWNLDRAMRARSNDSPSVGVCGLAFSPDGKTLASSGLGRLVRLWDTATGTPSRDLSGHQGEIRALRYLPSGKLLASGGDDRTIRIWDTEFKREPVVLLGHNADVYDLATSPDGRWLASASIDHTLRLWDLTLVAEPRILHSAAASLSGVSYRPDGKLIATTGKDRQVTLVDPSGRTEARALHGHNDIAWGVRFTPDGRSIISSSTDGTIRLWDPDRGSSRVVGRCPGRFYWFDVDRAGRRIAAACSDKNAYLFDLRQSTSMTLRGHTGEVNRAEFSADGSMLATASDDGTVRLWDPESGRPLWRAPLLAALPREPAGSPRAASPELCTHRGWLRLGSSAAPFEPRPAAWRRLMEKQARYASHHEAGLLCVATFDEGLELWDPAKDRPLWRQKTQGLKQLVALPSGCLTLAGGSAFLHLASGSSLLLSSKSSAVAYDRGEILVAVEKVVLVFDSEGTLRDRRAADVDVSAMARTRQWLVLGFKDGNLELRPREPGRAAPSWLFESIPSSPVLRMVAGPLDTIIAGFGNGMVGIWSLQSGALLGQSFLHGPVAHLLLDGSRLHAASELGDSLSWDLSIFERDYCEVVRDVWREAPASWESGVPVLRAPPRAHRCR